ncbi:MAG: hypothetical protein AB7Q37_12525 [Pyrinomonadaceae bacterium]
MKGTKILTIAVCLCCFLIGYFAYLSTTYIVDYFKAQVDPCESGVSVCTQNDLAPR